MLDIQCRVNAYSCVQQLFHILIPLGMTSAWSIGMSQLVHQSNGRMACQHPVQVHLLQDYASMFNPKARNYFLAFQEQLRLMASVGLHQGDDYIHALLFQGLRLFQHLVSLANARSCAHEYLELARLSLLPFAPFAAACAAKHRDQGGTLQACSDLLLVRSSNARLSFSTFTLSCPSMPNSAGSIV